MEKQGIKMEFRIAEIKEKSEILELLVCCFPLYWKRTEKYVKHLNSEQSFVAKEDGIIVGHVGILKMILSDGKGGSYKVAGVASVAVNPNYRKRGIAKTLCELATKWALDNDFDSIALYTELCHVYESCGWEKYDYLKPYDIENNNNIVVEKDFKLYNNENITPQAMQHIKNLYENSMDFSGKKLRTQYDWEQIFQYEYKFAILNDYYAIISNKAIIEINSFYKPIFLNLYNALNEKTLTVQLPFDISKNILDANFLITNATSDPFDNEVPMIKFLKEQNSIFAMVATDKF